MNTKSILDFSLAATVLLSSARVPAQSGSTLDEVRALVDTPDKKQRVECVSNLKQVAMAIQIYTAHNEDVLPQDMLSLSNELASTRLLVCPADPTRQAASDWASATTTNLSYKLLAPSARVAAPQQVVLLCPVHGNVSLMDGSVQSRVARTCPERFILKAGQALLRESGLPSRRTRRCHWVKSRRAGSDGSSFRSGQRQPALEIGRGVQAAVWPHPTLGTRPGPNQPAPASRGKT